MTDLDFDKMDAGQMLAAMGTDGMVWTKAFRHFNPGCSVPDDVMFSWFCNAIMAGNDTAMGSPILCGDHAQWLLDQEQQS